MFSKYELDTIATDWNNISTLVQESVSNELSKFDYVAVKGLDITGLKIAEEYRAAVEQKQICLLYTSPSPRDKRQSRMPSSA